MRRRKGGSPWADFSTQIPHRAWLFLAGLLGAENTPADDLLTKKGDCR